MGNSEQKWGLSGNILKVIALVTMTIDHVGLLLMDNFRPFRLIGRLAFPLFAYMIAEGCRYTKNKRNYFLRIFGLGFLCQLVYYFAEHSLYQGILMTFSVSVLLSYAVLWAKKQSKQGENGRANVMAWILPTVLILVTAVLCGSIPLLPEKWQVQFDYGFWGILLPVFVVVGRTKIERILLALVGMIPVAVSLGGNQWMSLAALVLLSCYNEQKGKRNMKYLFYIYYPLHMAVIYGLTYLIY
ncbi:MAG: TraX family protein [Lachnospiraceae bacterium]